MKSIVVSANEILIINSLHKDISFYLEEFQKEEFNGIFEKQIPIIYFNNSLFALDANHLCFVARILGLKVKAALLEQTEDIEDLLKLPYYNELNIQEISAYLSPYLTDFRDFIFNFKAELPLQNQQAEEIILKGESLSGSMDYSDYLDKIRSILLIGKDYLEGYTIPEKYKRQFKDIGIDISNCNIGYSGLTKATEMLLNR